MTLSNRFGVLEDGRGAEDHGLSDDEAASTVSDTASVVGEPRVRRRLSLVWEPQPPADGGVQTEDSVESERSTSEPDEEVEEMDEPPSTGAPVELDVRACSVAIGMASLDEFHLKERARVMRTVHLFLKGAFRGALRVAFEEAQCVRDNNDDARNCRAWKLFMLLPRMLLNRPPRGGQVPKKLLEQRFQMFSVGRWAELVRASLVLTATGAQATIRRRRRNHSTRRGAATGPSGMTADHLQPVLDTARDTSLFLHFATVLARGQAPVAAVEGVRMGRITALKKPGGGIWGIVIGDILRRLVARTMAKQMAARVEAATATFQYALTTKAV